MLQRSKSKQVTAVAHILVWAAFALAIFLYRPILSTNDIPYQFWIRQTVTLGLLVIAFYVNASILVPRFLLKNLYAYYFLTIVGIVAVIVFIHGRVDNAIEPAQFPNRTEWLPPRRSPRLEQGRHIDPLFVVISALVLGIGTSMTAIQKWQKDRQKREALERENVRSELSLLKAQVNPHFFFNTLNNIYALTEVDARLAGKAIHQLSRMMRYLLYETQSGHTMLSQEISFIKDYISLMALRLTDAVKITIETPPVLKDLPLAPMIFLPFVENAFKHGVRTEESSHIGIVVAQQDTVLDLTVRNSILRNNSVSLEIDSGIGLANTRRRLDLLYPGRYRLDILELSATREYTVHLVIDLS